MKKLTKAWKQKGRGNCLAQYFLPLRIRYSLASFSISSWVLTLPLLIHWSNEKFITRELKIFKWNKFCNALGYYISMKQILLILILWSLTITTPAFAQRLMNSSRSTVGYIEDERVLNSSRSTIGYIEDGRIMSSNRSTLGYFKDGRIMNSSRSTIGYTINGRVMNSNRSTIGYVEDGRVLNSSRSTIGYYKSVKPSYAALFFFFFFD